MNHVKKKFQRVAKMDIISESGLSGYHFSEWPKWISFQQVAKIDIISVRGQNGYYFKL